MIQQIKVLINIYYQEAITEAQTSVIILLQCISRPIEQSFNTSSMFSQSVQGNQSASGAPLGNITAVTTMSSAFDITPGTNDFKQC